MLERSQLPDCLYHSTDMANLPAIMEEGLTPERRRRKDGRPHVYLCTEEEAHQDHSMVCIRISVDDAVRAGVDFFVFEGCSRSNLVVTEFVPPSCLF